MNNPKISIIVPIYKAEDTIRRLLDSFECQKTSNVEFFLIDNASPDKCGEICQEYVDRDSRFVLHTLKENIGYIRARMYGIKNCSGEFVGFSDSDDYIPENCYEEILDCIEKENPDFILCSYYAVNGESVIQNHCSVKEGIYHGKDLESKVFPSLFGESDNVRYLNGFMWENFYKKEICLLNNIGFVEDLKPYEDQIFNIDFAKMCTCIAAIDKPVYYYVYNNQSITGKNLSNFDAQSEYQRIIKLHNERLKRDTENKYSSYISTYLLKFIYSGLISSGNDCEYFGRKFDKNCIEYINRYTNTSNKKYKIVKYCLTKDNYLLFKFYLKLLKIFSKRR